MSRCDSSMHGKSRRCGSCNDSAQLVFAASKISAEDCALNMLCAEENTSERLSGNMAHSISRQARHVDAGNERRRTWTRKDKSSRVHVPPQKSDFSAASSGSVIYVTYASNLCLCFDVLSKGPSFAKAAGRRSLRGRYCYGLSAATMLLLAALGMQRLCHAGPA